MKHISFIAFTALLTLGTMNLQAEDGDELYQKAHQKYAARSYAEAFPLFEQLSQRLEQNAELHFHYGRCALELKRYDEALGAFERVLIIDPGHIRARLQLVRLYYETGRYAHTLLEIDTLRDIELSADARQNLWSFQSAAERKMSRNTFSGTVAIGGGYDSNANNDIGDKTYTLPLLPWWTIDGEKETDTTFVYGLATLRYGNDLGEQGGWSVQNSLTLYTKRFTETEENDLNFFALKIVPTWTQKRYRLEFPLSYERVYLHNESYLYNLSATAKATYLIDQSSEFSGGYTFRRGYYSDETLDASTHHLFATYKQAFGTHPLLLTLNAGYVANREVRSARTDVDRRIYQYGFQLAKTLPYEIAASIGYLGETIHYSDDAPLYTAKRHDNRHTLEASVSYPLRKELWLNAKGAFIDHRSNYTPYDYDKTTAMVSLVYSF